MNNTLKETSNTLKAREDLSRLTNKPIKVISLDDLYNQKKIPGIQGYNGATIMEDDQILVALNYNRPDTNEATFVHEIQHIILELEGYPRLYINSNKIRFILPQYHQVIYKLMSYLSSAIHNH